LNRLHVPAGRVLSVPEALATEQVRHRQLLRTLDDFPAPGQSITVTRSGFKLAGADPEVDTPPPRLGEHTEQVLLQLGYDHAEIGLGDPVSRMGKRMKIRGVLRDALRQKSVGIIEEIPDKGIVKYGKPAGIVACIVPTTNPDLTPAGNAIYAIKARDVVIFSPHPRSKKTSLETVRLMREALERDGAPADILQCLTKVNIPMSQALMARADLIIATGGQPMVRAAYSSGTPAYGVGAGNSTMIIDETANIEEAARNTRQ